MVDPPAQFGQAVRDLRPRGESFSCGRRPRLCVLVGGLVGFCARVAFEVSAVHDASAEDVADLGADDVGEFGGAVAGEAPPVLALVSRDLGGQAGVDAVGAADDAEGDSEAVVGAVSDPA